MANWQEEPQAGQTVWSESHKNGIITGVDYSERMVYADHYDNGHQTYELDDFLGCFDEKLNQWVLIQI